MDQTMGIIRDFGQKQRTLAIVIPNYQENYKEMVDLHDQRHLNLQKMINDIGKGIIQKDRPIDKNMTPVG